jgi:uncharacterized membrane protein
MAGPFRIVRTLSQAITLIAFTVVASTTLAQDVFRPSLKFCNRTTPNANVAVGFDRAGSSNSTSLGWYVVKGCTRRTILQNTPLKATEVFLIANRDGGTSNVLQPAKGPLCIRNKSFNMTSQNSNAQSCSAAGGSWALMKMYDTKGRPFVVNLTHAGQCNLMGDQ